MTASAKANPQTTLSRREALNYAFGASIALALVGSCGGLVWFLQQRISFKDGSGYFKIDLSSIPERGEAVRVEGTLFQLARFDTGLVCYSYCPYPLRGCGVRWSKSNQRFECPCCGSKFHFDGTYIEGPARHGLDRLVLYVTTDHGTFTTPADGSPVPIEGATSMILNADESQLIIGQPRPPRLT